MTDYSSKIRNYGLGVNDFEVSPFESINMLHTRSYLEKVMQELSTEDRIKLYGYDMILIQNAKRMAKHIGEVYDFSQSKESLKEWWWHLDKVANGEISFLFSADIDSNMVI